MNNPKSKQTDLEAIEIERARLASLEKIAPDYAGMYLSGEDMQRDWPHWEDDGMH